MADTYLIHRSEKSRENPYAQISRKMAQDSGLSFQARGLLLYILSKPPKWKGKAADLQREGKIKEKALKTILNELIEKGYVVRHEARNMKGRFEYKLEVFEESELNSTLPASDACLTVPPSRGVGAALPSRLPREGGADIYSTGASAPVPSEKNSLRENKKQEKPRRAELFALPPDSMLEFTAEDHEWLRTNAPHVPDYDRALQKWFLKQQTNGGKSKTIEQWGASRQAYMMNYSDGEQSRNGSRSNGNGKLSRVDIGLAATRELLAEAEAERNAR